VWEARVAKGGTLGGSQWGSASDGHRMYIAVSDLAFIQIPDSTAKGSHVQLNAKAGGGLLALEAANGKLVWKTAPASACARRQHCSPAQMAAVTLIGGAVFSGSVDGHLRAYSTATGAVLWDVDAAREFPTVNGTPARGGSFDVGGVAAAKGMLFACSGYGAWGGQPGKVLLAFTTASKP
jgi:polyvinyl alcohol dehydrogenase (cytochrome)